MFFTMVFSSRGDSGIVDEIAHIPAGYSYLVYGDFRLNPEHPPLIKDLAAFPLIFLRLNFPHIYWLSNAGGENVNNQWEVGWKFIYHSENNYDQMFFWSRLPIIILSVLLGLLVFKWANELFGSKAAVLAVFLYSFCPNMIAHSRFVTTDLGIAFFYVFSVYFFGRYLKDQSRKNLVISGVALGLAQAAKFSAVLLIPTFIILAFIKFYLVGTKFSLGDFKGWFDQVFSDFWRKTLKISWHFLLMLFVSGLVVLAIYYFHTKNMPISVQETLIDQSLLPGDPRTIAIRDFLKGMAHISRPAAQYLLGLFMVIGHVGGGHTAFLLGDFSPKGWWYYFPIAFLVKTPILTLILILLVTYLLLRKKIQFKFEHWLLIIPVIFYFYISIRGSLNIGYRHLLPILPFVFIYTSQVANWIVVGPIKDWWKK
ncbi:MAG: phospholipid carrier-dependent glycosyltransferase, partial [Candidatus Aenigmarchaeota archaeon]|nr:phospholipid carrier-dependent glycosyltransferase [Candidatus Aenigmarchaeota archaeon]